MRACATPGGGGGPGARTACWGHVPMHACAGFAMQFACQAGAAPHDSRSKYKVAERLGAINQLAIMPQAGCTEQLAGQAARQC